MCHLTKSYPMPFLQNKKDNKLQALKQEKFAAPKFKT